jgi:dUTP pyrophosphatase
MTSLRFSRIRDVKSPVRGTPGSAGIDFFVPDELQRASRCVHPGDSILIPSGIKAEVPEGYALIAFNKSGVSTKKGLQVGACVVDSDYQGEIHIHLANVSDTNAYVYNGEKVVQFLLVPVSHCGLEEVDESDLFSSGTERGEGGFGSTGVE